MKFFKKYLILFVVLLSVNSMAIESSSYQAPSSCTAVVEAGKKIALNKTNDFSSQNTMQSFIACNLEVLPQSLSTEIMYSIFGDPILTPLSHINGFIQSIYTKGNQISVPEIDELELGNHLKSRIKTFPVLTATIEALTFASFQLISFMMGIFSFYYLVNTMSEGTYMGKQVNTFWTFAKMAGAMALIFPLDGLGLNIVQLIIIFIAFCGSFLASLIWSILPLFKYSYLTEFTAVDEDLQISKSSVSMDLSEYMITSSLCDITARQSLLLKGRKVEEFTENLLETSEMFTCLKEATPSTIEINPRYSFEHNKTAVCAKSKGVEHSVDCGEIMFSPSHSETFKTQMKTEVYDFARTIAKKALAASCKENELLQKGDASRYYTYCSNLDEISFGLDYKGSNILKHYNEIEYEEQDYIEDILSLQALIELKLQENLAVGLLNDEDVTNKLMRKISFALNKGWFNAGTFMFDIGESTVVKDVAYGKVMLDIGYEIPEPRKAFLNEMNDATLGHTTSYATMLEARYKNAVAKGDIRAINSREDSVNIFTLNEDLEVLGIQDKFMAYKDISDEYIEKLTEEKDSKNMSSLTKLIFPTLALGVEFNEPELGADESCAKDYNNCKVMPVNPLATIIDTSRNSAAATGKFLIITKTVSHFFTKSSKKAESDAENEISFEAHQSGGMMLKRSVSLILDFASIFLSINMLISLLAGYILPIVLFIYFVGNALSWILSLVLSVVGATLWMGLHLMPSKEAGFAGHAKKGYLMIMDVFLKPVFLVLGVFGAFILSTILVVVFNATFETVMSTFSFFNSPESIIEMFYNFLLNFIYVMFLIIIFFRSAKAVYKIPNALEKWIGILAYDDASMWKEVTGLIQRTFLTGMKKFLIFA